MSFQGSKEEQSISKTPRSAHPGPLGPPCALLNPLGELPKLRETEAQTTKGMAQGERNLQLARQDS